MKISLAFLLSILLSACGSKQLNEASAKAQVEEALRGHQYIISIRPLLPLMAESEIDYKASDPTAAGSLLLPLITNGFVKQESHIQSYPVITGTFEGNDTCVNRNVPAEPSQRLDFILANQNQSCFRMPLTLKLEPVPNSNRLAGTSNRSKENWTASPISEAILTPDNTMTLRCDGSQGTNGTFSYIERQGVAYLIGRGDYLYVGPASGKRTEVRRYSYSFVPELHTESGYAPGGQVQVGEISNLRLTTETSATANFGWRVALSPLAKILIGDVQPAGSGVVEFGKKPDGTWVLIAPPQLPSPSAAVAMGGD